MSAANPAPSAVLPWQADVWARVQDARRAGTLGHALLVSGLPGTGKRHFAEALAASLLCAEVDSEGLACGRCRSCVQLAAGSQPNRMVLEPPLDEKTDRRKRDIPIEQVRQLGEWLTLASHYNQARIAILDPADALNLSGMNALLKTVEEPPAGTHLVLLSSRPNSLAATLRSRCQQIRIAAPAPEQARSWLLGQGVAAAAELVASDPLLAAPLQLAGTMADATLRQRHSWLQGLAAVSMGRREPMGEATEVLKNKDSLAEWMNTLQRQLARLLRASVVPGAEPELAAQATALERERLLALIDEVTDAQRRSGTNLNPQMTVESLMIAWWRLTRSPRRSSVPPRSAA